MLAVEVVIQVGGGQLSGSGDVAHPGVGEPAFTKQPGGGAQDRVALPIAAAGPGSDRCLV